jgi:hypothetical protein
MWKRMIQLTGALSHDAHLSSLPAELLPENAPSLLILLDREIFYLEKSLT